MRGRSIITAGADTYVKIFDADKIFTAEPRTIEHHDAAITTIALNRKATLLATGTESHLAAFFNFPNGDFVKNLVRAQSQIQHIAFDNKGRFLAIGADDGVIRIAVTNSPTPMVTLLKGHSDAIMCVAYDPKGEYLASSSADGTVRIWDLSDEPVAIKVVRVADKLAHGSAARMRIAWSPDGSQLAIPYANTVHVLERGTWSAETTIMSGHTKEVSLVAWSKNGQYLATGGLDRQIFVYQMSTAGQLIESLDRHKADAVPTDLAWSPAKNTLAFLDELGQIGAWNGVIPTHLPSPVATGLGETAATGLGEPAAVAAAAPATPVAPVGESTMFSLEEDAMLDGLEAKAGANPPAAEAADPPAAAPVDDLDITVEEPSGGGRMRRLRKVQHDSDDGGFSDHDDDEAAEAALLAREIAKRGRSGIAAVGADGNASAAVKSAVAALAGGGAVLGGAAPQPVVHASATPLKNGRRFLLWNMTGLVISRDENVFSAIEVEFNSTDKHRTIRLTDHYGFTMAALDHLAVMFASRSNNGNASTIVYRPLSSWAPNSEWQLQLDTGEEALAIAIGHKFAAIATSKRYLRILSHTGAQRALVCTASNLVALAASGGTLAVVHHAGRATTADDQALQVSLYDLRDTARPVRVSSAPLPLSEGATLDWIGFSESGTLATVDSAGLVRGCLRSCGFEWVPLLDTASVKKAKNEHHWVVGLTDKELLAVMCRGEDRYPATLPRPLVTPLALAMPLACAEPAEPAAEKERLLSSLMLNEYRASAADDGMDEDDRVQAQLLQGFTKLDASILKLIASACKHERTARALDLCTQLQLPKSLSGALRLANHYKLGPLADRITRLMEARFTDDGNEDEDVEQAPAPVAARPQPSRAAPAAAEPTAPQPKTMSNDDVHDDADDDAADANLGVSAAVNPFGKSKAGDATKETVKGPKRTLPVSAIGSKKSKVK